MKDYIVGIGAANVDIYGKSEIKIREHYDHPSIIKTSLGGVTRNILENAARLGVKCKLLTAVGDDYYGQMVLKGSKKAGIDVSDILVCENERTGCFMQVQDENNDMYLALCDMSVAKRIDIDYLESKREIIENAKAVIIDPSLNEEVINYILNKYDCKFFVDPISDLYASKFSKFVDKVYCIKPNKNELKELAHMDVFDEESLIKAVNRMLNGKLKHIFVSLGKDGCLYNDENNQIQKLRFKPLEKMVNASGAGDAFMACILYGFVKNLSITETVKYALAAGIAAIQCEDTINSKMGVELLCSIIKENENGF